MDFSTISSVKSYVKNIEMKQKWQQKKEKSDFTPKSQIDRWIEEQREQARGIPGTQSKDDKAYMQTIHSKIANGQTLTIEEENYLRDHDTVTYQQIKAAKAEKKSYERELKQCKTKDEVDRVRMAHISSSLTAISSVKNNPDIPKGQKFAILMVEKQKMDAIGKITDKFIKSGAYAGLPTDEEKREAEKVLSDAENEQSINSENTEKTDTEADVGIIQSGEDESSLYLMEDNSDVQTKSSGSSEKITVDEARNTPEMQKLRRARARAAYSKTQNMDNDDFAIGGQINLNV